MQVEFLMALVTHWLESAAPRVVHSGRSAAEVMLQVVAVLDHWHMQDGSA